MKRRRFLHVLALGSGLTAGCLSFDGGSQETPTGTPTATGDGTPTASPTPTQPTQTPMNCDDLKPHPIDLSEYDHRGDSQGLELSASRPTVPFGEEITFRLRNTSQSEQLTGNEQLYALQRATPDGWEHVYQVPQNFAFTEEAIIHQPDGGFTWTFPVSQAGLTRDSYTVCSALEPGVYRFVYWGMMDQNLALSVQFTAGDVASRQVEDYDSYVFDHAGLDAPIVDGGIQFDPDGVIHRHVVALLTSAGDADRFDQSLLREVDAGAADFVANTDFATESLLVFQEFPMASSPDYSLERVERQGEAVHVFVDDSSQGGTADITVETVLVRIPHAGDSPPRYATVTTEDDVTYSTVE